MMDAKLEITETNTAGLNKYTATFLMRVKQEVYLLAGDFSAFEPASISQTVQLQFYF